MEFSIVIPCTDKNYDSKTILDIFNSVKDLNIKFELVLCTGLKYSTVSARNVLLTNKDTRIKSYLTKSSDELSILKNAVSRCVYMSCIVVSLDKFTDLDLRGISLLVENLSRQRFTIYVADNNSFMYSGTYDFKRILGVCYSFSILDILNAFDFIKSNILVIHNNSIEQKTLRDIVNSDKILNKLYKKRKSKLYRKELCEYNTRIEKIKF